MATKTPLTWTKVNASTLPAVLAPLYKAAHDAASEAETTRQALRDAWRKVKNDPTIVVSVKASGGLAYANMTGSSDAQAF